MSYFSGNSNETKCEFDTVCDVTFFVRGLYGRNSERTIPNRIHGI